ncbi:MAG TPA: GGDEF domain-containing protein [Syntrophomonadaceae bacterium]|nr:GGDEF domain-containing protein [Syntrophomonadaceae bacterium]
MATTITIDIVAIITLWFTTMMAKRNTVTSSYNNTLYIAASAIAMVVIAMEIATILLALYSDASLVIPHRIANVIGFSLTPVLPFLLLLFHCRQFRRSVQLALVICPLIINAGVCILSFDTGWIFFINEQNQYMRGEWFLLPTLVSMFYFILMVAALYRNSNTLDLNDKKSLMPLILLPVAALVVQIVFPSIICLWASIALCLLLYFVFLRELHYKYDIQTGVKTRSAFEKEMHQYAKKARDAVVIVIDINNLKLCNDLYGHGAGDETISYAAQIINQSFSSIGQVFRIGGDEFCVICPKTTLEIVKRVCCKLEQLVATLNAGLSHKISLAYGYALHDSHGGQDIYDAFAQADQAMYSHKAKLKGLSG